MAGSILGTRVLRKEDPKFLTSGGKYIEDLNDEPLFAGALHVTYVRSTVAHAKLTKIDLSDCKTAPGVVAVFTAHDLGLEEEPSNFNPAAKRAHLAIGKVRWVGELIAAVVTERPDQGEDAIERAVIEYETLENSCASPCDCMLPCSAFRFISSANLRWASSCSFISFIFS